MISCWLMARCLGRSSLGRVARRMVILMKSSCTPLPLRYCDQRTQPWCHQRDDDDADREYKKPRARSFFGKVSSWVEG
jgi:hypothetical protein